VARRFRPSHGQAVHPRSPVLLPLALVLAAAPPALAATPAIIRPAPAEARAAAAAITEPALRAHVKFLASDLLEGRAPGTRGDRLTQAYVATQLEALGLEGAAPGGGFFQPVPLLGVTTSVAAPFRAEGARGVLELRAREDYLANAGVPRPALRLDRAEVVFVGYGIVAPEFGWDDYRDVDVTGKVVLVMNDDPSDDPALFEGKRRLYYGRWTYKLEEAARHGSAGVVIIHTTPSASYPWTVVQSSWSGEQFELPEAGEARVPVRLWTTEDASRKLTALGGHDLDGLREQARRRGFRAVALGVTLSIGLATATTRVESANVLARLPGSDPVRAREAVLYTAHHDHLGKAAEAQPGEDAIYNGAVDNATGVAALLAVARAHASNPARPARSVIFAALAAEEQGTLGAEQLVRQPPVPLGRVAAVFNVDAMNVFGRTRDVTFVGRGKSTLDEVIVGVARAQQRTVRGDPFPDKGSFYRSDHFPLAKAGVPAAYLDGGVDYLGRPEGWGEETLRAWDETHYHQPSDEWRDDYDLAGMVEDARLLFHAGAFVANARELPRWRPGDEFEAARQDALRAVGAR
jgi:Zn-dependent M28 family amino/carboxypeptidase